MQNVLDILSYEKYAHHLIVDVDKIVGQMGDLNEIAIANSPENCRDQLIITRCMPNSWK